MHGLKHSSFVGWSGRHLAAMACVAAAMTVLACSGPPPPSLEGLWVSDGYGTLAEIDSSRVALWEVTEGSCLPSSDDLTVIARDPGGVWTLSEGDGPPGATLTLESESTARLQPVWAASSRVFRRVTAWPAVCEDEPADTAPANLEVFAATFREHYPFFSLKGIDWEAATAAARARVDDSTSPEELFDLLAGMIAPLEDAHTRLVAESIGRVFMGGRADPEVDLPDSLQGRIEVLEPRFARALEIVEAKYLSGSLLSWCNGHLRAGMLRDGALYVRLDQEEGYTDEPDFAAELAAFEAALDEVFGMAVDAPGIVLDVRKNYGGSDILSLALASRLTGSRYLAYAKVARLDPDDPERFTPPEERFVEPSSRPGFLGPVVELTGRYTISAGETLTQALMGREPHIRRVGESTQGVFSDVLGRRLPNGWIFGLPNELFLTAEGASFDGPGIPPDVEVPVFRTADLEAGDDPALERALELLASASR